MGNKARLDDTDGIGKHISLVYSTYEVVGLPERDLNLQWETMASAKYFRKLL